MVSSTFSSDGEVYIEQPDKAYNAHKFQMIGPKLDLLIVLQTSITQSTLLKI